MHRLLTDLLKGLGELASEMLWLQFCVKHGSSAGWAGCEGFLKATSVSVQDESKLHNVLHEKKKRKKEKSSSQVSVVSDWRTATYTLQIGVLLFQGMGLDACACFFHTCVLPLVPHG